jgi:cytochrome c biogenesis protein CcmG, thiol:disulfide interchange protein DsbE
MHSVSRRILYLAIFLLGFGWTVVSRPAVSSTTAGRIPAPQVGFLGPSFKLTDLSGQTVNLSDYQGQAIMLNFWASWCPPCRVEMPAFQQVFQSYQDQGLVVLAVNASYQDVPADMKIFLETFTPSFPILLDDSGLVARLYAISSLPTTFIIGKDGTIREIIVGGPLSFAGLSTRAEALLQEAP